MKKTKTGNQFLDSFIDNVCKDTVTPIKGSVVHCGLLFDLVEHSGIYIGDNQIVHLNGNNWIEAVSPDVFLDRLGGGNTAISIYVSCIGTQAVGSKEVAKRAKKRIGDDTTYDVVNNNCHRFSSGCLTGDFENDDWRFSDLETTTRFELGSTEWRVWNR